jgi:hypothetical protein
MATIVIVNNNDGVKKQNNWAMIKIMSKDTMWSTDLL